jgi:hypothetical protein
MPNENVPTYPGETAGERVEDLLDDEVESLDSGDFERAESDEDEVMDIITTHDSPDEPL